MSDAKMWLSMAVCRRVRKRAFDQLDQIGQIAGVTCFSL
jgi:hypothetical protein